MSRRFEVNLSKTELALLVRKYKLLGETFTLNGIKMYLEITLVKKLEA